jgi:acyl-[acyl-carrier-protein]-phospholipid O-acyltransferase/long-chain-fatty-acid--[acyl-carrier-protein] ligase
MAVADSTGLTLTYGQLMLHSIMLAELLRGQLAPDDTVGILLPPSAAAVVTNLALTLLNKLPVNLNYTIGDKGLQSCVEQCDLKHIISSRRVLRRLNMHPPADIIVLEDVRSKIDTMAEIKSWLEASVVPEQLLHKFLPGLSSNLDCNNQTTYSQELNVYKKVDEPAAVLFSSGSSGEPKGILLSHHNVLSNIQALRLHSGVETSEVIFGVAPMFHSFGYTLSMWAPLCLGHSVVYHYDPFDALTIAKLFSQHQATTLICTPTMLGHYVRRCAPASFRSLKHCIVGGEQMSKTLVEEVRRKWHITPLEGYGLTETSPVISCNVPCDVVLPDGRVVGGTKIGTVGTPLPGTSIRIVDPDTRVDLPVGTAGLILVKGPQVMMAYLNKPELTASVLRNGWFETGDIGFMDEDCFLTITGRKNQFSKIGGEMVPHLALLDEIIKISGLQQNCVCIVSIPDRTRGERLIVVYTDNALVPEELLKKLKSAGLPRLWLPDLRNFFLVDSLPILASGKIDLAAAKAMIIQIEHQ